MRSKSTRVEVYNLERKFSIMNKSNQDKGESEIDNGEFLDDVLEGSSARTRPFSFDDIILARKTKGDETKNLGSGSLAQDEVVFRSPESHSPINDRSVPIDVKHATNDSQKDDSSRKGDNNDSRKNGEFLLDKHKGSRGPDFKLKSVVERNFSCNTEAEGKIGRHHPNIREKDVFLVDDSTHGSDKKQARYVIRKSRISERSRREAGMGRKELQNAVKEVPRKRKIDARKISISQNDKAERDLMQTDKPTTRVRDKTEKGKKHRHLNEVDKIRGRSPGRKHDSETKALDLTRANLEESRIKRRRAGSREHIKERAKSSLLLSPKMLKHASKDKRDHEELSSVSTKHRLGRDQSDTEKKRLSTNGAGSHYRRNSGSLSGLGGYSPRKRKTDAAAKTPSPTHRSPEKRSAGWDLQPAQIESTVVGSTLSNMQTINENLSFSMKELPSVTPMVPISVKPVHHTFSSQMQAIESVQLTEATRPMRRLYVDNLPASASEKDLIECINQLSLSSGVNCIQGTQPCISCILHKDKGQALLEFLTPEDASVALSFNGLSFSGGRLKLRRPKDYAIVTTGLPDKLVVAVDSVSSTVEDSPHKIFIGRISKLISSKMLLEIARAFGAVKAFRFEINDDIDEPYAFLEYVDRSVTSMACAGLNGMRLGGKVLTAVFATPDAALENVGKLPFYGIPELARPLLEKPTTVLKLRNVFDPERLLSMTESELEGILEDIRLECSRFGTVKSMNVAKAMSCVGTTEAFNVKKNASEGCNSESDNWSNQTEQLSERLNESGEPYRSESPEVPSELENRSGGLEGNKCLDTSAGISDRLLHESGESNDINRPKLVCEYLSEESSRTPMKDETCKPPSDEGNVSVKYLPIQENSGSLSGEPVTGQTILVNELENKDYSLDSVPVGNIEIESIPWNEGETELEQNDVKDVFSFLSKADENKESDAPPEGECSKNDTSNLSSVEADTRIRNLSDVPKAAEDRKDDVPSSLSNEFEAGSVFIEYRRSEAACMAAHNLHGRTFDGRIVTAGYVRHDLYQSMFGR